MRAERHVIDAYSRFNMMSYGNNRVAAESVIDHVVYDGAC